MEQYAEVFELLDKFAGEVGLSKQSRDGFRLLMRKTVIPDLIQAIGNAGPDAKRIDWLESRDNVEALLFQMTSGEVSGRPLTVRELIDSLMNV